MGFRIKKETSSSSNEYLIEQIRSDSIRFFLVYQLPPLKRKPPEPQSSPLAIEAPTSNQPLAIEYHHDQTISNDYATISSRRSSRRTQELQLVPITPHSQRPIQQEWYEEFNKTQALQVIDPFDLCLEFLSIIFFCFLSCIKESRWSTNS